MNYEHSTLIKEFDSLDIDQESFRQAGYEMIDTIADYYKNIRERRIITEGSSIEIEKEFDEPLPVTGQEPSSIINEWKYKILPHATHLGSPRYFGFVNGSGTMMSVFASALASSVNMNSGGWKAGPSATEVERRSIAWIAELIRYNTDCGGLFVGGGMIANFAALLTALRTKASYNSREEGLQTELRKGRYTIYMSDHEGHVSIMKAADLLNLGRTAVRRVKSNEDLTMNANALEELIEQDKAAGMIPFCVVAQVGSINVGVVDPLEKIAAIASKHNLWFHADGACGAIGAMLPELQHLYKGLQLADSVTLDPHKWMYISYECGCLLVKDPENLRNTFSMSASYLQNSLPTDYKGLDYFDHGPQMSRGFNALKVWMSLKYFGKDGYQKLLRQNIQCAKHIDHLVRSSTDFLPMHQPELFIYSFRFFPAELREHTITPALNTYLDLLNQKICDEILSSGFAFIMTSKVKGHIVIRLSICSHRTTLKDMGEVFNRLGEIGRRLFTEQKFTI